MRGHTTTDPIFYTGYFFFFSSFLIYNNNQVKEFDFESVTDINGVVVPIFLKCY